MPTPSKQSYRIETFKLHSRFRGIQRPYRLAFLIREAAKPEGMLPFDRIRQMRDGFDRNKVEEFSMAEDCHTYQQGRQKQAQQHRSALRFMSPSNSPCDG